MARRRAVRVRTRTIRVRGRRRRFRLSLLELGGILAGLGGTAYEGYHYGGGESWSNALDALTQGLFGYSFHNGNLSWENFKNWGPKVYGPPLLGWGMSKLFDWLGVNRHMPDGVKL